MARRQSSLDPLFDEPKNDSGWVRYALMGGIVAIVGFIAYAAIAGRDAPQGPVPVIRADETPWTRTPGDAGGMEIPNQDSTVFELMDKNTQEPDTTAADTEAPADTVASVDKSVDDVVKETVDTIAEKPVETSGDETAKKEDVIGDIIADEKTEKFEEKHEIKPAETAAEKPVDKPVEKPADKPKAASMDEPYNPKAETKTTAPAGVTGKNVQVRLGSVPGSDKAAAAGEYNRLKALSGGAMSGASPSYESVTLDGKGSFVRINVSMSKDAATKLCDTLSAKGAPCLILGQ